MKSHAILRTNVALTTNAKIMVTGSYSLYVDSIISNTELSSTKYKRKEFNKANYWDEILPYFFKGTPTEISYFIKDDDDNKNMSKEFSRQYDDLYQYGARNIIENKDYTEEFEYFAPLHVSKTSLPKFFIIFRVDGPGLINLTKENFETEIIKKLKCVKAFDLTRSSLLGEWLETNITKNKNFPQTGLFIDFRNLEFSSWVGIDYEDGGYSEKSLMLDSTLGIEQTYQDFEKFVLDGYKNNKVVYPHILNFSFLFDDTPATPTSIRTWSINRYMGFYLDELTFVKNLSPCQLPKIKSDVVIDSNNIIYSISESNPFVESFITEENPYIEIGGQFYKISKFLEQQPQLITRVEVARNTFSDRPNQIFVTRYKIISNVNLEGRQNEINKNIIIIDSSNKITSLDGSQFQISDFDDAHVWLILIDGIYHNIVKIDNDFYINTDYAFTQSLEKFDYYINDPDPKYRKSLNLKIDANNPPKQFAIFKCKFTSIKEFDTDIVDTEYSKFEYLYKEKLTDTDETKMYAIDLKSSASPKDLDDFKINGVVVNIPTSSEYIANHSELFRLLDKDLNFLWKKNSKRIKWGFQNSVSSNDYPYLLNNSFTSEDYNRTCNPYNPAPNRVDRNLDYFLTINSGSNNFSHHSLHVEDNYVPTFQNLVLYSTFLELTNISDISYFRTNDLISIETDDNYSSYDTTTRIKDIIYTQNVGWRIITDYEPGTPISGTISGRVQNITRTNFCIDKYLNIGYDLDYFDYFFSKKTEFDNGNIVKNTNKYSYFNSGDNSTPNITLFRGLKFKLWDVRTVKIKDEVIESINIVSNNRYEDYKFSILLSSNNFTVVKDSATPNNLNLNYNNNLLRWQIIDEWKHDKIYQKDDLVKWNDSIYKSLTQSQITNPRIYPFNSTDWQLFQENSIFWNKDRNGESATSSNNMTLLGQTLFGDNSVLIPPLVYNYDSYYYSDLGINGVNFWNPYIVYHLGNVVLHKGKLWRSNFANNTKIPDSTNYVVESGVYQEYWSISPTASSIWKTVELWDSTKDYLPSNSSWGSVFTPGHYVVFEDVVYSTITIPQRGLIPSLDNNWKRVYSLVQNTQYQYSNSFDNVTNPIIEMNNRLYYCRQNGVNTVYSGQRSAPQQLIVSGLSTLENGINIYINKKWKNVLVNIYVNDNSFTKTIDLYGDNQTIAFEKDNLSNNVRDNLYSDIYSKLTANNFMNAINDLSNYYDFSDKIRYIIINEDLSMKLYDFNDLTSVANLPALLTCEGPDEFLVKIDSLITKTSDAATEIKPKRRLDGGQISSLEEINYYSDSALAVEISTNRKDTLKVLNYSGLQNNLYNNLFRQGGYYSPIFHEIELFENSTLSKMINNYKFDTTLTHFGKIKERIVSKINRQNNILKLKDNPDILSTYPTIDEFGYHTISSFIFKSTWDYEYHVECQEVPQTPTVVGNQSLQFGQPSNGTNTINLNQL